jgi:hypothetical protein
MKMTAMWIQKTIVCAMTLALACSVLAETQSINAKVTRIKGSARYSTDSKTWSTLKLGQVLWAGTVIQTAKGSFVDLVLGDALPVVQSPKIGQVSLPYPPSHTPPAFQPSVQANTVRLYEDSALALDKLTCTKTGMDEVSDTQFDLRAGKMFGRVKKLSPASKYEIKLPNGVAGIRGTMFTVDVNGVVTVLEGTVVISIVGADGKVTTVVVEAGNMYDPRSGGPPTKLPDTLLQELILAAKEAGAGVEIGPTSYTIDQTIINVSPTTGTNPGGNNQE